MLKTASDSILQNMNNGNFDIALIFINQLSQSSQLPPDIQVYHVQCLYALHRYLEAHALATKYIEAGNDSRSLTFMTGLLALALERYDSAISIFNQDPQWSIWKQKAYILSQLDKNPPITFHDSPPHFDQEDLKYSWSQTPTEVILSLNIPYLLPNQVKPVFHIQAIDLTIEEMPQSKFSLVIELEKTIIPRLCSFECFPDRIEFKMFKEKANEEWTFKPIQHENLNDISLDSVMMELDMIQDIDNNTALLDFQKAIEKLDYAYSSEDEYEENDPQTN